MELWAASDFGEFRENRAANLLQVVARLNQGVTRTGAQAEMDTLAAGLASEYPETNKDWGATVVSLQEQLTGDVRPSLLILFGAVGFVLLIACANVANLLLVRASSRQQEIALRAALGASRGRICRQLLTESVCLASLSGSVGTLLAFWGIPLLLKLKPEDLPRASNISVDATVLAFTLVLSLVTGLLFGLAPVLHAAGVNLIEELKEGGRHMSGARRLPLFRRVLLVAEVAIAVVLLAGAGLLIRSFAEVRGVDPGFQSDHVLTMDFSLPANKYGTPARQAQFFDDLLQRIEDVPGVESAGAAFPLPLVGGVGFLRFGYSIEGRPASPQGQSNRIYVRWVSPRYFHSMGIPLRAGRSFNSGDDAGRPPVVIVDETLVKRDFPNENPIGRRVMTSFGPRTWREIVGVVGGVHQTALDVDAGPHVYLPFRQMPMSSMSIVVKSRSELQAVAAAAKTQAFNLDPELPVFRMMPMTNRLAQSVALRRFSMLLLGLFATLALALSAGGVYGVLAYSMSQRTHEMGVRLALGAQPGDLRLLVMGQGMALVMTGVGVGTTAALGLTPLLAGLLYGVAPRDPMTLAAAGGALSIVGVLACYLPARRATLVDPVVALRHE